MYIVNRERQKEAPEYGIPYEFEHPCDENGGHEYAFQICECGRDFCYTCATAHDTCPDCGRERNS